MGLDCARHRLTSEIDGRLARKPPKGALGEALHAVLWSAGHNLRLIIHKLKSHGAAAPTY